MTFKLQEEVIPPRGRRDFVVSGKINKSLQNGYVFLTVMLIMRLNSTSCALIVLNCVHKNDGIGVIWD